MIVGNDISVSGYNHAASGAFLRILLVEIIALDFRYDFYYSVCIHSGDFSNRKIFVVVRLRIIQRGIA